MQHEIIFLLFHQFQLPPRLSCLVYKLMQKQLKWIIVTFFVLISVTFNFMSQTKKQKHTYNTFRKLRFENF